MTGTIPHNKALMEEISRAASRGALGAAYLICGPGDRLAAAKYLAAAMECRGEGQVPCLCCEGCRKVFQDIHPDVITIEDPEHKNLSLEVVRAVRAGAYIVPNEGRRKIYIFPDCERLEAKGQNVLLKVLEEGPAYAAFFFLSENPSVVLPTIRSRCRELRVLSPEETAAAEEPRARELIDCLLRGNPLMIAGYFTDLETAKCKREELLELLKASRELLAAEVFKETGKQQKKLLAAAEILDGAARELRFNLGVGHVTGALAVKLGRCMREERR